MDFSKCDMGVGCAEYGINNLSASYRPDWQDEWKHDVRFRWTQGRHGADGDRVEIGSTIEVNLSAKEPV